MTVSVTVPPIMVREIEKLAEREGKSQSDLVLEALRLYLVHSQIRELQRYGMEQSSKLDLKEGDVERLIHEYRRERREREELAE